MINLTNPEIAEIRNTALPRASLETLEALRNDACQASKSSFSLQSQQKFLRRVLSPDSPTRNLLMVHGTGTGKTCTAIQIAEEYILRPEFQDKKVLVISSLAVQNNFQHQIFDMTRVDLDKTETLLVSKQCTGRRYLDMLLRVESEPKNWNDPKIRARLEKTADTIINEFYEFSGYMTFGNRIRERVERNDEEWIHHNFDNRLVIIDEAHNIREPSIAAEGMKGITDAMEKLVKVANGMVLVFLTATPMYDSFEEIMFYFNLFLWNDRKQDFKTKLTSSNFFESNGKLKESKQEEFRGLVQQYVSYVKGDNPFTFPFRLPPPNPAPPTTTKTINGKEITDHLKYLQVVASQVQGDQKAFLDQKITEDKGEKNMIPTIAVFPGNSDFRSLFRLKGKQYSYADPNLQFLKPELLPNYSAKFASIIKSIESSEGVIFVYCNYVQPIGTQLFAMALEEAGYSPESGNTILENSGGTKGKYVLLSSSMSEASINGVLSRVKSKDNINGSKIRVVISSPFVSEGVDFRFIRQVHVIDPWWNMSRIEQVVGRALRTCSHQLLPFDKQNCTVYLHVVRNDDRECYDEYTYRTKVEEKATKIANVRRVLEESAMDCPIQNSVNNLPQDWKELQIPQTRAEGAEKVVYTLQTMLAPTFSDNSAPVQCLVKPSVEDPEHVRPLSSYLDTRDEILNKLETLFIEKPIWDRADLIGAFSGIPEDVIIYTIQSAITNGIKFKDAFDRPSLIESKGELYALTPVGIENATLIDRIRKPAEANAVPITKEIEEDEKPKTIAEAVTEAIAGPNAVDLETRFPKFKPQVTERFSKELLMDYTFDHYLKPEEKRAYIKAHHEFRPQLRIPDTNIFVLGDNKFEPPEAPIGDNLTKYNAWEDNLIKTFTSNRTKLYGSVKENSKGPQLVISKMTENGERDIKQTGKRFEPTTCGTGSNTKEPVHNLSKKIDKNGVGIPATIGSDWCQYMELLIREKNNTEWVTPEELSVIFSEKNKQKLSMAFKTN